MKLNPRNRWHQRRATPRARTRAAHLVTWLLIAAGAACSGPSHVTLWLEGDSTLNPNPRQESTHLTVRVFQLASRDAFEAAPMTDLWRRDTSYDGTSIATSLVGTPKLIVVKHGTKLDPEQLEIAKETKFIGVLGQFADPADSGWRQVLPVGEVGSKLIFCTGNRIEVRDR